MAQEECLENKDLLERRALRKKKEEERDSMFGPRKSKIIDFGVNTGKSVPKKKTPKPRY
jgi:hypothetical protein